MIVAMLIQGIDKKEAATGTLDFLRGKCTDSTWPTSDPGKYIGGKIYQPSGVSTYCLVAVSEFNNVQTACNDPGSQGSPTSYTWIFKENCGSTGTCSDSDGGKSYNIKGTVTGYGGVQSTDFCSTSNTNQVFEFFCDSSNTQYGIGGELSTCPYGCVNGACIANLDACSIIESGGIYTNCQKISGGVCSADDRYYCADGYVYTATTPTTAGGTATSYLCMLNGQVQGASFMTCPNGCANGVCKQQICSPNFQWCDRINVMQCSSNGMTKSTIDTCASNEVCEEKTSTSAICVFTETFYCKNNDNSCYTWGGTGNKPVHCYSTLSACQNEKCDFDLACESSQGETFTTCPSDCNTGCGQECTISQDTLDDNSGANSACSTGWCFDAETPYTNKCQPFGFNKNIAVDKLTDSQIFSVYGGVCANEYLFLYCKTNAGCNDNNPCTNDICGNSLTCGSSNKADGASCGSGMACKSGVCEKSTNGTSTGGVGDFSKYLPWIIGFIVIMFGLKMTSKAKDK